MTNGRFPFPARPQQPQQVQIQVEKSDQVVCADCGGIAIVMNAAFLPKHQVLVGSKPSIVVAPILICSDCGKEIMEPYSKLGDAKQAS